jgi:hypothetical protein
LLHIKDKETELERLHDSFKVTFVINYRVDIQSQVLICLTAIPKTTAEIELYSEGQGEPWRISK